MSTSTSPAPTGPIPAGPVPAAPTNGELSEVVQVPPLITVTLPDENLEEQPPPPLRGRRSKSRRSKSGGLGIFSGRDIAVDLGTANTIVYVRDRGIVLNEPSVVAVNTETGDALAVGFEAKRMVGRTPGNIRATSPLENGVIADFDICEKMLRHFIGKVCHTRWPKPRMVICVPSAITGVEQRAVLEAAEYAGASKVYTIEEPIAAAIGAGLPVQSARGSMIVDIGGGTTEVAVISLGGLVSALSLRTGGKRMDEAIIAHLRRAHSLSIGERTAESVKMAIGSAWPLEEELQAEVSGTDAINGLPKTVVVSSQEVRAALSEPLNAIIASVKETLDKTPPDLAADVMDFGITITGGGALLQGIDQFISNATGVVTHIADDPLHSVVIGSGQSLEHFETMHSVMMPYNSG